MPQQECSKNDIFSIKNTPNLTVNTVYDSYISHYNTDIEINSNDYFILLEQIHNKIKDKEDECIIDLEHPSILFQKYIYNSLGHFGVTSTKKEQNEENQLNNIIKNNLILKKDNLTIPVRDTWLENNNNIIQWNDKNKNWANAQFTCINQQGACGDCWANAATECITIRLSILTGYYCPIDINQVLHCTYGETFDNGTLLAFSNGCFGGEPIIAMNYIANNSISGPKYNDNIYPPKNGVSKDKCINGQENDKIDYTISCKDQTVISNSVYNWNNYTEIINDKNYGIQGSNGYNDYKNTLIKELIYGPITINIWSSGPTFTTEKGVYNWVKDALAAEKDNKSVGTDHALLLVGYDKELQTNGSYNEYWIIQNSWSVNAGNNGFIKVSASSDNIEDGFTEQEKRAFPFNMATYCTPFFTKIPTYDKSTYQKCCPTCEKAFRKNISCSAIDKIKPYGNTPIFPTINHTDTVFTSTKQKECIAYNPLTKDTPVIDKNFTLSDIQRVYNDTSLTLDTKLLPFTERNVIYKHPNNKQYGIIPYILTPNIIKNKFFSSNPLPDYVASLFTYFPESQPKPDQSNTISKINISTGILTILY